MLDLTKRMTTAPAGRIAIIAVAFVISLSTAIAIAADNGFYRVAVIGGEDDRLQGSYRQQRRSLGDRAAVYLGRALRVSFPHPGSLVVTGTPVCFDDVVVTAAHVYINVGDGTSKPMGLRIAVPDLDRPGYFRDTLTVRDYRLSSLGRRYDPNKVPDVRDDFLALLLNTPVPAGVSPLALLPYRQVLASDPPLRCERPTLNAAYHADLGLLGQRIVDIAREAGDLRITAAGAVPLLTSSTRFTAKLADGARYGDWYLDPYVVFPEHDTHELASGSALVCPTPGAPGAVRDYLYGVMVGQLFFAKDNLSAINVATVNLPAIYRAIAALKGVDVNSLHERCTAPAAAPSL